MSLSAQNSLRRLEMLEFRRSWSLSNKEEGQHKGDVDDQPALSRRLSKKRNRSFKAVRKARRFSNLPVYNLETFLPEPTEVKTPQLPDTPGRVVSTAASPNSALPGSLHLAKDSPDAAPVPSSKEGDALATTTEPTCVRGASGESQLAVTPKLVSYEESDGEYSGFDEAEGSLEDPEDLVRRGRKQAEAQNYTNHPCSICGVEVPVIMPNHESLRHWDLVLGLAMVWVAVLTPWETSFLNPKIDSLVFVLNRLLDLIFLLDMILTFNLAVPNRFGRLLKNRVEIRDQYLRGWFAVDLVSLLPYDAIAGDVNKQMSLLRLVRLLKMLRLLRGNRLFARLEARHAINYALVQLYGYLGMLILLTHWLACGWFMVTELEDNKECVMSYVYQDPSSGMKDGVWVCCYSWLDCFDFKMFGEGDTLQRKYFLSLVWATGEVLTVGSSVTAVTDAERTYMVVGRFLCGVVYAYLLGAVCSIFTQASREQSAFFESMDTLNKFLKDKLLHISDPELCGNLRRFYRFAFTSASASNSFDDILGHLSPSLKGALAFKVHSSWLRRLPLFKEAKLSPNFYLTVSLELEVHLFAPLESIIQQHQIADCIFVVEKGIILARAPKAVKTAGHAFGEDSISAYRTGMKRHYQATAFTHGTLYKLKADTLFEIMRRPQFTKCCKTVLQRIAHLRAREVLLFYYRTVVIIAASKPNFNQACDELRSKLDWVNDEAMPKIFEMFARVHKMFNSDDGGSAAVGMSATMKKANEQMIRMQEMKMILTPFNLETLISKLVLEENLTPEQLKRMTAVELHAVGAPMGNAMQLHDFYHKQRSGYVQQRCSPSVQSTESLKNQSM